MKKLEKLKICASLYPDAKAELNYSTPFQLMIAVLLSAQTTDIAVNKVTEGLFAKYPDAFSLKSAEFKDVHKLISKIGLANSKAKNAIAAAKIYDEEFLNIMPQNRDLLVTLPGVGQKTANVVLANIYHLQYIAIDTHIHRICIRLGISKINATVVDVENDLIRLLKKEDMLQYHHSLLFFGRYLCKSRNPQCDICPLTKECRFFKKNLKVLSKK